MARTPASESVGSFAPQRTQDRARDALIQHLSTLPIGHRLPPIKELARRLQFGHSNLNEAMRQLARQGVVYSRPKLGTFLARQPGTLTPLRTGELVQPLLGRTILMRLADGAAPDAALFSIAQSAEQQLRQRGAAVQIDRSVMLDPLDMPGSYDLVVLINPPSAVCDKLPNTRPMVIASTSWHARTVAKVPSDLVGLDQLSGASMAGEALRAAGCKQFCYLGRASNGKGFDGISQLRLEGFEMGLGEPVPREHQFNTKGYSIAGGARGFVRWVSLKRRPLGVFAVCDDVAVGFYAAAVGGGLRPARDFHLIGFDGLASGQIPEIRLTTIGAPFQAMGRTIAEMVVTRLTEPTRPLQVTYLGCNLIQGKTTAPARRR
jgi:DNA-binding transcriptional regulator YhcF (GntR family)